MSSNMSSKRLDRVVFYTKEDMSAGYNLLKAERLLASLDITAEMKINDLLELYNIKEYFDNGLFLQTWDEITKSIYQEKIVQSEKKLREFFLGIDDEIILTITEDLEFSYRCAFWHLINYYQTYKQIKKETFSKLLKRHPQQIRYILANSKIVAHFDAELRGFLIESELSAELLLAKFEQGDKFAKVSYIFPKSLSLEDKEGIILQYINQNEPNLNYIRLIEHSKDSIHLKLSAKTRLKAKKKSDELSNKIFQEVAPVQVGVQITLDKDQEEPVKFLLEGHQRSFSYGVRFLDAQTDDVDRFMLFRKLFDFTNHTGLITLYGRLNETNVLERIAIKSKNEYPAGMLFLQKNQTAFGQLISFNHYLVQKGMSVEELIQSFIQSGLDKEPLLNGLQLRFPLKESSFLEKIRSLAPELEFLLKQYQVYSTEGKIDFELIQINDVPSNFSDIKSLLKNKYAYSKNDETEILKYHFYSDQSMLHYVEFFKDKYFNLYDLLENEEVKMETFADYQQDLIKRLISEGHLSIDSREIVRMKNDIQIFLIGELHRNEVISYWHYPKEVREVLDEMEGNNMIRFEDTLFSEPEISYYNYYLNKKEYTNGLNIRNKYLHGSNSSSEREHKTEYYILVMLVILALLKIVDDLLLQKRIAEEA